MDIYLKARLVLETLRAGMPGALVDYAEGRGMHRFPISCGGLRYELSFHEQLLEVCNPQQITHATRIIVDHIQRGASPRRTQFGSITGRAGSVTDVRCRGRDRVADSRAKRRRTRWPATEGMVRMRDASERRSHGASRSRTLSVTDEQLVGLFYALLNDDDEEEVLCEFIVP